MPLTPPTFSGIRDPAELWETLAAGMLPTAGVRFFWGGGRGALGLCRPGLGDRQSLKKDSKYFVVISFRFPLYGSPKI